MVKVTYPKLDLRVVSRKVARALIATMKRSITQKKGLSGQPAAPNARATIARKGKDHRMVDTGAYYSRALTVSARMTGFLIDLNTGKHPGPDTDPEDNAGDRARSATKTQPTFEQIAEWNQKGHPNENTRSANHEHFGVTQLDGKWALEEMEAELWRQIDKGVQVSGRIELRF